MRDSIPESLEAITAECSRALSLAPVEWPPALPPSKEPWGAPKWYEFEWDSWSIGEGIRQSLAKNPKLRKPETFGKLVEVATCRNLRRGRQSFIMAMRYTLARQYAAALAPMLTDPDVDGQVLNTLLKMKASGFTMDVRPLQKSDKAWVRRLSNKYLDRYSL